MKPEELITTLSALEQMGDYETDKDTTHSYLELYDQIHDRAVVFDRTNVNGRSDDIAIVIKKGKE
jgi:predicted transcriptional regulator